MLDYIQVTILVVFSFVNQADLLVLLVTKCNLRTKWVLNATYYMREGARLLSLGHQGTGLNWNLCAFLFAGLGLAFCHSPALTMDYFFRVVLVIMMVFRTEYCVRALKSVSDCDLLMLRVYSGGRLIE